jgi:uncharacterized protein YwgA
VEKHDFTMLVLALAKEKGMSPVQLQKSVFLLGKLLPPEVLPNTYYDFRPYNYGPFCNEVYEAARNLEQDGLASVTQSDPDGYRRYAATSAGIAEGEKLLAEFPARVAKYAGELVDWVLSQTFASLVTTVYSQYPEYRINSVFRY